MDMVRKGGVFCAQQSPVSDGERDSHVEGDDAKKVRHALQTIDGAAESVKDAFRIHVEVGRHGKGSDEVGVEQTFAPCGQVDKVLGQVLDRRLGDEPRDKVGRNAKAVEKKKTRRLYQRRTVEMLVARVAQVQLLHQRADSRFLFSHAEKSVCYSTDQELDFENLDVQNQVTCEF